MTRCEFRRRLVRTTGAVLLLAALVTLPTSSIARADVDPTVNNLSIPAIFVPGVTAPGAPALRGGTCGRLSNPSGPTSSEHPGLHLQKTQVVWQAECANARTADVVVDWGDELTKGPISSSRQPIRVEVALDTKLLRTMSGFVVERLTLDHDDRFAKFGTTGEAARFPTARVFDAGARLTIRRILPTRALVYDGPIDAEIDGFGSLVHVFDWGARGGGNRVAPGTYSLTVTTSVIRVTGVHASDAGAATWTPATSTVTVTVSPAAGKRAGVEANGNRRSNVPPPLDESVVIVGRG